MARKKTRKPKLSRLFDQSAEIVAVVDSDFEVVYANSACCDWLCIEESHLLATEINYSSVEKSAATGDPNGICPSPDLFVDPPKSELGAIFANNNGFKKWKKAVFTTIFDPTHPLQTVLIVAYGPDLPHPPAESNNNSPSNLHMVLSQLKQDDQQIYSTANLIGKSQSLQKIRRQVEAVANNDSDCLIIGPRGSGKEHLARTIFFQRNRDRSDLIPIHCSIADSQLIQNSIKEWVFEQRSKRTNDWLLLIDIDQLGREAQSELLGYTQIPDFHLRILATSASCLEELAKAGNFNQELANYLSIQNIRVSALKDRIQDLPLLTQYFVERENASSNAQISGCSEDVLEAFYEYHWPRNLDELGQTISEAHKASSSSVIEMNDLPDSFRHGLAAARIGKHEQTTIQLDEYLASIETELIRRALDVSQNNKTKAAQMLGISRAKLLRRASATGLIDKPAEKTESNLVDESAFKEAD